ncbi:disulfide bond formation protein B [Campylobacter geochelonis]|uniref:disulfide bond formation protein B n=1 Tax=Campylobacter geochelonis TaxID=1780362 RepID=UPI000770AFE3|nr:disulfide bond formation protein B [Campylobacter geochelonis]CZE50516.1 DsbB family disulfide bond formation protein [Campylobacter geochelonis]
MENKNIPWGKDETWFFNLFAIAALALVALPVGIACVILGFGFGDSPCIMCWQERFCMVAISFMALMIVRYGFKVKYLAILLFLTCLGLYDGFTHYSLDGTYGGYLDIRQGFGLIILGAHTQFWVVVVHFFVFLFLGLILLLGKNVGSIMQKSESGAYGKVLPSFLLGKIATIVFVVIMAFNLVQAFVTAGPPPYLASATPSRMDIHPSKWFWELDHWKETEIDYRADWNPELPDLPR